MFFKAKGKLRGRDVAITWTDSKLEGDETALTVLRAVAAGLEGRTVGIPGLIEGNTDFLSNPYLTIRLLEKEVLDDMEILESDLERINDDIPYGSEI